MGNTDSVQSIILALGWLGIFAPVALGGIGSIIGCTKAGQAAIGALLDVESGYGKYIGISVMPSTMIIFGVVVTMMMLRYVKEGTIETQHAAGLFGIGVLAGVALMLCGINQGRACASCIQTSKSKPEIFGISITPAGVIEGFAIFVLVFALIAVGTMPIK
jgi:V/A-type H+-transporting ATPase subunit K